MFLCEAETRTSLCALNLKPRLRAIGSRDERPTATSFHCCVHVTSRFTEQLPELPSSRSYRAAGATELKPELSSRSYLSLPELSSHKRAAELIIVFRSLTSLNSGRNELESSRSYREPELELQSSRSRRNSDFSDFTHV